MLLFQLVIYLFRVRLLARSQLLWVVVAQLRLGPQRHGS